jgi:hypothetical protein
MIRRAGRFDQTKPLRLDFFEREKIIQRAVSKFIVASIG